MVSTRFDRWNCCSVYRRKQEFIRLAYLCWHNLSYRISTAPLVENEDDDDEKMGISTGITLQVVNGKAFLHLLILMTTFGTVFGSGFIGKMLIALVNVIIKLVGWFVWGSFGSGLRQMFSDSKSGILINRIMGLSLFSVAIWIARSMLT